MEKKTAQYLKLLGKAEIWRVWKGKLKIKINPDYQSILLSLIFKEK